MTKRKILVTGGSGFVGLNFQELVDSSHWKDDYFFLFPNSQELNLLNKKQVENYLKANLDQNDVVIHLAGMVGGVKFNSENHYNTLFNNASMALNLIDECVSAGVENFIGASSTCVYPFLAKDLSSRRTDILGESDYDLGFEPTNYSYALAKSVMTTQIMNVRRTFNYNYKIVTPCNMYGSYMHYGEDGHFIAAAIKKLLYGTDKPIFWGTGQESRQLLYVNDFCEITLQLIDKRFENINILDENQEYKAKDVIDIINIHKREYEFTKSFGGISSKTCSSLLKHYLPDYKFITFKDWFFNTAFM